MTPKTHGLEQPRHKRINVTGMDVTGYRYGRNMRMDGRTYEEVTLYRDLRRAKSSHPPFPLSSRQIFFDIAFDFPKSFFDPQPLLRLIVAPFGLIVVPFGQISTPKMHTSGGSPHCIHERGWRLSILLKEDRGFPSILLYYRSSDWAVQQC